MHNIIVTAYKCDNITVMLNFVTVLLQFPISFSLMTCNYNIKDANVGIFVHF